MHLEVAMQFHCISVCTMIIKTIYLSIYASIHLYVYQVYPTFQDHKKVGLESYVIKKNPW